MDPRRVIALALCGCLALEGAIGAAPAFAASEKQPEQAAEKSDKAASDFSSPTKAPEYKYEIKEESSFSIDKKSMAFQKDAAVKKDGDKYYLVGADGKSLVKDKKGNDQDIVGVDYLGDGLYAVATNKNEINSTGLVNSKGKTLIPFEAALIKKDDTLGSRDAKFLKVAYATDKTTKKEECFVYSTDQIVSLSPGSNDTMYKGYATVYSIDKDQMVKDIKITDGSPSSFKDLGDSFLLKKDNTYTMYDASGKSLWSGEYATVTGTYVIANAKSTYSIVNSLGKETYSTKDNINSISDADGVFKLKVADKQFTAIDKDGKKVLDKTYSAINYADDGMFEAGEGSDESVVDGKGNAIVKASSTFKKVLPGYCTTKSNNEYVLIKSGEKLTSGTKGTFDKLLVQTKDDEYLILNDGKKTISLYSVNIIAPGLVRAHSNKSSTEYGLYDLFTGEKLLDEKYEAIEVAGDYVYAYANGTWTTYKFELGKK